jgi:hypothetical protein
MNPDYVTKIQQNTDKLLAVGLIKHVEKPMWLSPIIVILKNTKKFRNCVDSIKLNATTTKNPCTYYLSLMKY